MFPHTINLVLKGDLYMISNTRVYVARHHKPGAEKWFVPDIFALALMLYGLCTCCPLLWGCPLGPVSFSAILTLPWECPTFCIRSQFYQETICPSQQHPVLNWWLLSHLGLLLLSVLALGISCTVHFLHTDWCQGILKLCISQHILYIAFCLCHWFSVSLGVL